ncbi:MAG: AMP-binding protein [Burkholderiales bacterium]
MVGGQTREQIGVTEAMQAAFGEAVFRMSHNLQERVGDPIRKLDWVEIERQREAMGLGDSQIAERIGLTRAQVTWIRNAEETRRFVPGRQAVLLELGGGKRFRPERFVPIPERFRYSDAAFSLRAAMRFDPMRVADYIARGLWTDATLPQWLARHARERGDAEALVQGERKLTWRKLSDQVLRLANGLSQAGVVRGEVVAVQLPNTIEFVVAYFAIARLGAVMATIHMPYRAAEIGTLLAHSRAVAAICVGRLKDFSPGEAFVAARAQLSRMRAVVTVGETVPGALAYADLLTRAPLADDVPGPVASDPFLLLYTSGTTSAPKAVPHPYHTMLGNGRVGAPEHRIGAADRVLSAAPLTHLFGLYSLHVAWSVGATCVLLPVFSPPELAATIERDRPTGLWTAPAHIAACRALGLFDKHDLGSLKVSIMSGSACPPELVRWFQAKLPSCAVTQLWGMTETQGALYTRPGDALEITATTAGCVSPGTEVRICDALGNALAPGATGELQVRGSLLFPGFFDNEAANQAAFTKDGWYRTGDLAVMDAAGNVAITGREKDIINRGGVKFNPRDLEDLLDAHPQVMQSAIVPMPDTVLGERACCFITLRPGAATPSLEELTAYLLEHNIAKYKLPERLVVVAEMPLTPTRKIIKGRLILPAA